MSSVASQARNGGSRNSCERRLSRRKNNRWGKSRAANAGLNDNLKGFVCRSQRMAALGYNGIGRFSRVGSVAKRPKKFGISVMVDVCGGRLSDESEA